MGAIRDRVIDAAIDAVTLDRLLGVLREHHGEWATDAIHARCLDRSHGCQRGECFQNEDKSMDIGFGLTALRLISALERVSIDPQEGDG